MLVGMVRFAWHWRWPNHMRAQPGLESRVYLCRCMGWEIYSSRLLLDPLPSALLVRKLCAGPPPPVRKLGGWAPHAEKTFNELCWLEGVGRGWSNVMYNMEQTCFVEITGREGTKGLAQVVCYMRAGFATGWTLTADIWSIGLGYNARYRCRKVLNIRWTC